MIILYILGILCNSSVTLKSQSNDRNYAVSQLEITYDYINIRKEPNLWSSILGKVYEKEIFTILETVDKQGLTWYKIKTAYGITGYISSGKDDDYVRVLE